MRCCIFETPLGFAKIEGTDKGISSVRILDMPAVPSTSIPVELSTCVQQLKEYFNKERKTFDLKLDPKGTPFQNRVWRSLQQIPYGTGLTYFELSKRLGDVKAIRAVANANARNPIWILIPCHRVIGSNGRLTGYAGGLHRKKWLLTHEGAIPQQSLF